MPTPSLLCPQVRANLPPGVDGWGVSLSGLMGMVVVGGLLIIGIYYGLQRKVGARPVSSVDARLGSAPVSHRMNAAACLHLPPHAQACAQAKLDMPMHAHAMHAHAGRAQGQ